MSNSVHVERKLLRVSEAAETLSIGRSHAYELVLRGDIPSVRVGKRSRRVPVASLDAYIQGLLDAEQVAGVGND